jgi:hypothetical protein
MGRSREVLSWVDSGAAEPPRLPAVHHIPLARHHPTSAPHRRLSAAVAG